MMFAALSACSSQSDEPNHGEKPEEPASRTVLVYMVANNSLGNGDFDMMDISEMQAAAKQGDLGSGRLLVYHSPYNGSAPMLKEVLSDGSIDTLKAYPAGISSITRRQMRQVVSDMHELAPANDYGLVLWSHAMGWTQDGVAEPPEAMQLISRSSLSYSYGVDKGQRMNITSLSEALDGAGFSFVYFDCCYMGSVEVAYQMRDVAPIIVAGPTETPLQGMPYQLNLKHFFAQEADLIGAAKTTYEYNTRDYDVRDCPISVAVYDTSKLDALASVTAQVFEQAAEPYPTGYEPQRYGGSKPAVSYFFDLEHYVRAICDDEALFQTWQSALHQVVLYNECTRSIWGKYDVETSCGFSTFIMKKVTDATTAGYNQLQWYEGVASKLF